MDRECKGLGRCSGECDGLSIDPNLVGVAVIMRIQFGLNERLKVHVLVIGLRKENLDATKSPKPTLELGAELVERCTVAFGLARDGLYDREEITRSVLKFRQQHLLAILE